MRIESNSSIGTFLMCPKLYQFKYDERLESLGYSSALAFGTFVHAFIEQYHNGDCHAAEREHARESAKIGLLSNPEQREQAGEQFAHDYLLAEQITALWHKHWQTFGEYLGDRALQFQQTEKEWKLGVSGERTLVGKRDGIAYSEKFNKNFLYEIKTSGDADRNTYRHKLQLDRQISVNIKALHAEGVKCDGVIYDILWKPKLIRKVDRKTMPDETLEEFRKRIIEDVTARPEHYFERVLVYRSEKDLSEAMVDLGQQFTMMEASETIGKPRNQGNCEKFGKLCQFFSLCLDGQKESLSNFRVRDRKMPELSIEVQS